MIDESKCNWPIEPVDVALTRINGTIFTTADLNSAYNQIPLDEESIRYTLILQLAMNNIALFFFFTGYQSDPQHLHQY